MEELINRLSAPGKRVRVGRLRGLHGHGTDWPARDLCFFNKSRLYKRRLFILMNVRNTKKYMSVNIYL